MKIGYIPLNLSTVALFLLGLSLEHWLDFSFLLVTTGLSYLLLVIPFTLLQLLKNTRLSLIEQYFACLVVFFFVYVPAFFFLNEWFGIRIAPSNILLANIGIFITVLILKKFDSGTPIAVSFNGIFQMERILPVAALFFFIMIHAVNFSLYVFMPEWDGYADLEKISRTIETGSVVQGYRGFFYTATAILSAFARIAPYDLFTIVFIGLQATLILVLYRLIQLSDIRHSLLAASLYLLPLSIPVLNMEIDMTRPQNIVIIFLPIFLYFLSRFIEEKQPVFLVFTSLIAVFGANYHEFFIFLILTYSIWLIFTVLRKVFSETGKDRTIHTLILACIALAGAAAWQSAGFLRYTTSTLQKIISQVADISEWKLWFLDQYASDGAVLQMGWAGLEGAAKYYAYYLSPAAALLLGILAVLLFTKNGDEIAKNALIKASLPLVIIFLLFSEVLPRLNYLYLPERFWLLIDIGLVLLAVPLASHIAARFERMINLFCVALVFFSLIGLSGSFYVASGKKALTSPDEYQAALWIRDNTPPDALFITQAANGIMVEFFAKRKTLPTDPEYFLSEHLLEQNPEAEIIKLRSKLNHELSETDTLVEEYTSNRIGFIEFADRIQEKKALLKSARKEIEGWEKVIGQSRYIVYSLDKFDTIYREREWWMRANAYGADFEKFNRAYLLVYAKNGVYIWKVR